MTFTVYLQEQGLSTATIATYGKYLYQFTQWLIQEELSGEEITYTELLDFTRWLQQQGKSPAGVGAVLCPVRHYLDYLVSVGKRRDNPAAGLFIKGTTRRLPNNLLTAAELQQLYDQYRLQLHVDVAKKIMLGLLIYQGVTTEELQRLQAPEVQLKDGKVFIRGSRHSNERWLKLEAVQIIDLQAYLKANKFKEGPLLAGRKTGVTGAYNIINQVGWMMKQLRQLQPKITNAQQIRNSVITAWLKQYHLRQVQYMAGHRYVSSTQRYQTSHLEALQTALGKHHPMR